MNLHGERERSTKLDEKYIVQLSHTFFDFTYDWQQDFVTGGSMWFGVAETSGLNIGSHDDL